MRERWHQLDLDRLWERLGTGIEGLPEQEAARRLETYRPNRLAAEEQALPLAILPRQIRSPPIYILLAAGVATILLGK